jgi:NAD(P)-dependent dehydrogenase (short-subunit alcohol dehydrogenase family)
MDSYIRSLAVITGPSRGIGSHWAKRRAEQRFGLVVAATSVSVDYAQTPALRTQVIAA